jgi:hypothetical protein
MFARVLRRAYDEGVQILAVDWELKENKQEIWKGKDLEVKWGAESRKAVDEEWLERVLEHEATGEKRSNWKATKKREEKKKTEQKKKAPKRTKAQMEEDEFEEEEEEEGDEMELLDEESEEKKKIKKKTKKRK